MIYISPNFRDAKVRQTEGYAKCVWEGEGEPYAYIAFKNGKQLCTLDGGQYIFKTQEEAERKYKGITHYFGDFEYRKAYLDDKLQ